MLRTVTPTMIMYNLTAKIFRMRELQSALLALVDTWLQQCETNSGGRRNGGCLCVELTVEAAWASVVSIMQHCMSHVHTLS
jgi:hypothetical protein